VGRREFSKLTENFKGIVLKTPLI